MPLRNASRSSVARVARYTVNARLRLFPSGFGFAFFLRCPFGSTPGPVPTGSGCFREWTASLRSGSSPPKFGGSLPSASLVPPPFGRRRRWLVSPCVRSAVAFGLASLSGREFAGRSVLSCPAGAVALPQFFFFPPVDLPPCDYRLFLLTPSGLWERTFGPVLFYARAIKQDAESLDADSLRSGTRRLFVAGSSPSSSRRLLPDGDSSTSLRLWAPTLEPIV